MLWLWGVFTLFTYFYFDFLIERVKISNISLFNILIPASLIYCHCLFNLLNHSFTILSHFFFFHISPSIRDLYKLYNIHPLHTQIIEQMVSNGLGANLKKRKMFIGNISKETTADDLHKYFSRCNLKSLLDIYVIRPFYFAYL